MCYNTISHYCYEVPDLNCGKRTDTWVDGLLLAFIVMGNAARAAS